MIIEREKVCLDGLGDGEILIFVTGGTKKCPEMSYSVIFRGQDGSEAVLRVFPRLVSAVRSWRRFIVLSEEIEKGYV